MTDDIVTAVTHVGTGLGGAGAVGMLMKWLQGKEAARMETTLAVLMEKVDQLVKSHEKNEGLAERIALAEQSIKAAHERLDGVQPPRRRR